MSLAKYIINFDELIDDLKGSGLDQAIMKAITNKYPQLDTGAMEALLSSIKDLLPDNKYKEIENKIQQFVSFKYDGVQKVNGALIDIPAIILDYNQEFVFDKDVYLTGLHLNQTGWKKEDRYSLITNKNKIIDNATTKEIGEHKYFNTYYKVNANAPISFVFHNLSGNSRQVLTDLEYLEGKEVTVDPEAPKNPDIGDIPNDWDIAVRMQWEENTDTDMDLHGIMGDMHVFYGNKSYDGFYLNWDWIGHDDNSNPEVISVKDNQNKVLQIYIHNFNKEPLRNPVNIKIYQKKMGDIILLKEYNIQVDIGSSLGYGVCSIDLENKTITDMFTRKNLFT